MNASNSILKANNDLKTIKTKSYSKKIIIIKKTGIFPGDPITGGKTIYFGVTKTPFLNMLQSELLKLFFKFNTSSKMEFKYNWMNKNNKRYGYPFVGKKWIPHLTIASLTSFHNKNKFITCTIFRFLPYISLVLHINLFNDGLNRQIMFSCNIA